MFLFHSSHVLHNYLLLYTYVIQIANKFKFEFKFKLFLSQIINNICLICITSIHNIINL